MMLWVLSGMVLAQAPSPSIRYKVEVDAPKEIADTLEVKTQDEVLAEMKDLMAWV